MEAETERSRPLSSSSAKRKPLCDSTNFVVPTSTILRKLSSSLSTSPQIPNPSSKSKPETNRNSKSKPYNFSAKKPDTNSKSDTSIGSSNYNENAPSPIIPESHPSTPPRVCSTDPGNRNEEVFEPLLVYSRRQTAEKSKYKGKAVALPLTFSSLQKTKNNDKADKVPFTSPPLQKEKDKGKAIALPPSFLNLRKTKHNGKIVSAPISFSSLVNTRNKRKAVAVPSSCPPLPRTRKRRNEFAEAGVIGLSKSCTISNPKSKKKKCSLNKEQDVSKNALPQEFIEQQRSYFKEIDDFELLEEEISEKDFVEEEKSYGQD